MMPLPDDQRHQERSQNSLLRVGGNALAIARALQWVISPGGSASVRSVPRWTTLAGSDGLRVLSRISPSTPSRMKRSCHRQTTGLDRPERRMISVVPHPSAVASMTRARAACFCRVLRSATIASRRMRSCRVALSRKMRFGLRAGRLISQRSRPSRRASAWRSMVMTRTGRTSGAAAGAPPSQAARESSPGARPARNTSVKMLPECAMRLRRDGCGAWHRSHGRFLPQQQALASALELPKQA